MPDGLSGYSLPRSPEGRASLVPPPPWHYVGDFLVIEYWADPDAVAAEDDAPDAPLQPVAKKSTNKGSIGGRKFALRRLDDHGFAEAEVIGVGAPPEGDHNDRPLLRELGRDGKVVGREPLADARERHARSRAELPLAAFKMSKGFPAIVTVMLDAEGDQTFNPYAPEK